RARVAPQHTRAVIGLPRPPRLAPRLEFRIAELHRQRAGFRIEDDHVAVLEEADRAADRRLGPDVADAEAARGAREPPVGDQRDLAAGALAIKRGRGRQHLAHARPAARSFVADHQHVAFLVFPLVHRLETIFLAIEAARRAAEPELFALHAGHFHDRALRREIAFEH